MNNEQQTSSPKPQKLLELATSPPWFGKLLTRFVDFQKLKILKISLIWISYQVERSRSCTFNCCKISISKVLSSVAWTLVWKPLSLIVPTDIRRTLSSDGETPPFSVPCRSSSRRYSCPFLCCWLYSPDVGRYNQWQRLPDHPKQERSPFMLLNTLLILIMQQLNVQDLEFPN